MLMQSCNPCYIGTTLMLVQRLQSSKLRWICCVESTVSAQLDRAFVHLFVHSCIFIIQKADTADTRQQKMAELNIRQLRYLELRQAELQNPAIQCKARLHSPSQRLHSAYITKLRLPRSTLKRGQLKGNALKHHITDSDVASAPD